MPSPLHSPVIVHSETFHSTFGPDTPIGIGTQTPPQTILVADSPRPDSSTQPTADGPQQAAGYTAYHIARACGCSPEASKAIRGCVVLLCFLVGLVAYHYSADLPNLPTGS